MLLAFGEVIMRMSKIELRPRNIITNFKINIQYNKN